MEYKKIKLKEVCTVNQGLQIPISKRFKENGNNRYFYITIQFLKGNSDNYYIENPKQSVICNKDDILVVRTGSTGVVLTGVEGCFHNNFFKVIPKNNIYNKYLYYSLNNKEMYKKMLNAASGTTIPDLKHSSFYELEIFFPEYNEQVKIAKTLAIIDKKIELNNQTNDNLYKIIKTQYDSFTEELKEYDVVKLKDIANISSGKRPKIKGTEFDIPLIGASGVMAYTDTYNFNEDILIIGRVGTLGVVQRYFDKIWASDNTLVIKTEYGNSIESYLKIVDYNSLNRGSTQPLITQTDISNLYIKFNKIKFEEFEKNIKPLREKIYQNKLQNKTLEQLRDTLLPKLMNGEIDLDKIEI